MTQTTITEQEKLAAILADEWCFYCDSRQTIESRKNDKAICESCQWYFLLTPPPYMGRANRVKS